MKNINKILAVFLIVATLFCMTGFTAHATTQVSASAKVFEGYNVTVLDRTSPAVDMRGRTNDRNVMVFVAADGREVGVVSRGDYLTIIQRNQKVVQLAGGGTLAVPPDGRNNWHEWFADEFNKHRGLNAGSRTEAVASSNADAIEEYRQELIRLVNLEREKAGLPAYIVHEKCMEYSQIRARELPTLFSHTRPDGTNAGYEIISAKSYAPEGIVKSWMESPGHRAAILNANRVYVGAGVFITANNTMFFQMYFERDPEVYANTLIFG